MIDTKRLATIIERATECLINADHQSARGILLTVTNQELSELKKAGALMSQPKDPLQDPIAFLDSLTDEQINAKVDTFTKEIEALQEKAERVREKIRALQRIRSIAGLKAPARPVSHCSIIERYLQEHGPTEIEDLANATGLRRSQITQTRNRNPKVLQWDGKTVRLVEQKTKGENS